MPRPLQRLSAAMVIVITLAIVGVLLLYLGDGVIGSNTGQDGSPSPSTGRASPSPTVSGSPSAGPSLAPADAFAQIEEQVLAIRELAAPDIGPADIITRDQLADELVELLDEEWTEEELVRSNLTLRAMGLLGEDEDIRELTEQLLAGQVIGFYDPLEKRMVVVSHAGLTVDARITYAHEYTHALQDAAFDTFAAREDLTDDDAILARQALEEGDATFTMFRWALEHLSPEEQQGIGATPVPDMSGIPGWMVRQLLFPYEAGFQFMLALEPMTGWAGVNDAYRDPPASTEQVLHPEKFASGERPIDVPAPAVAGVLGSEWQDLEATTMGEAMIDIWLAELGTDPTDATTAAAGWGGDRLVVASAPDGEWAMAWRIVWDAAADADEFEAAYAQVEGGSASRQVRASATETVVLHASAASWLADLEDAFGG